MADIIIPALKMRKLRHREINLFASFPIALETGFKFLNMVYNSNLIFFLVSNSNLLLHSLSVRNVVYSVFDRILFFT